MSLTVIILITLAIGIIVGGILVLKKSAKAFNLSDDQLEKIQKRNAALAKEEQED